MFEFVCNEIIILMLIAHAYGRYKAISVLYDDVKHIFRYHLKGMIIEEKNEFISIKFLENVKVRVPNLDDDYLQPIAYICVEDLALAMEIIT